MKMVSVTFGHKSPMTRFDAIIHINVVVPDDSNYEQVKGVSQATRELCDNVRYPENWRYLGVTQAYEAAG